ncbi:MAG: pyruvate dehydrogenase complex dihydrolipoamide acetyltransferase [Micavibrio sp.]|nr:pyruvate dehydrogenase complex dihydrolipoamide acetyltransferase [Micavibrio sp.]|tara:strand:+ start:253 stop:1545 length:1293 start_codon:yes stop_codon:yes gene_type:complete
MTINVTMPALSPTMEEGNLAKWHVKEGDSVESGDVIAEIETDKATMEVEAVDEGIIGKIIVSEGTQGVKVNEVIAVLLEDGETANDIGDVEDVSTGGSEDSKKPVEKPAESSKVVSNTPVLQSSSPQKYDRIFASPLAKRIASQKGLDLSSVKGSGPKGRIVKRDVENLDASAQKSVSSNASAMAAPAGEAYPEGTKTNVYGMPYVEIPNNNIKKVTAKRLLESKQSVPHFYLTVECNLDALLKARKDLNDQANGEFKLSVNDFIIKASAMALKSYPAANVSWTDDAVHQYLHSDISIAVATPTGLITPIIKKAETKGLRQISDEMKELAGRAREGKLKPEEFQGGGFSISNLGMFGVKNFQAIVNPPQSCILAVGAGEQMPKVINGEIKICNIMSVTLSTDHRSVDGAIGAEFLQHFKRYIENPVSMLV